MFVIGVVLVMMAWLVGTAAGSREPRKYNRADNIGAAMLGLGIVLISVSLGIMAWRYLP